ncbi:hypothetical protein A3F86_02010 [candidate division WOR-1 bacterium RIFCSPLOWO2_12_FULL_45_9]|uniref:Uncharacterized protein n=1 Tax=candidate division WOR-1 bacterium RIFCSPLOWO2_12_FULL_45_9 TaxID=1802568 RepID=A0A1F4RJR4_UNCSA|nr:MAG: hypothetical protein A3F86_02010 [candidate division WOR-1 bacterium RIFCSPLOWO2_12_FULL_45_9]
MSSWHCPICENKIDLRHQPQKGERITCQNCYAQLAFYEHKHKIVIGCAICKESIFDPTGCGECERRHEKKRILEEGRL